jgi:hypothetical protein
MMRPLQTAAMSSYLLITRPRLRIRYSRRSNACGATGRCYRHLANPFRSDTRRRNGLRLIRQRAAGCYALHVPKAMCRLTRQTTRNRVLHATHWRAFGTTNEPKRGKSYFGLQNRVNGGESVSQLPLKDKAFLTFLDQNPPFELRLENGFRLRQRPVPAQRPIIDNGAIKRTAKGKLPSHRSA